jgi:hypothetical protein
MVLMMMMMMMMIAATITDHAIPIVVRICNHKNMMVLS